MRTTARRAAGSVAVIAAGALLVSGCGSGGDDAKGGKGEGGDGKPETSASASEPAEKPDQSSGDDSGDASDEAGGGAHDDGEGSGSGESGKAGKLTGIWKAKGKQYVLTFVGDKVTLLRERGRNCTGTLGKAGGTSLALKCPDGGDQSRTNGKVGSLQTKSFKVAWKGGPTEVYARVSDVPVKLPENS
ncbi:hypothetical protein [Streptomyces sp. WMMB 322]|uniref:hypothetical protein n=1 Tax=Streptomyces sp. WMMB 322 TaxID=1286821 RepID=UPI000823E42C|nr:hypothetical protein [Streptomyces sp. WMMB 322]SCK50799.1 hypothetical protein H180DRAFT_04581 [Streptomyces sp. WMMB 322]